MAYQISSSQTTRNNHVTTRALTLVEVMVALGIGSFVLTGVITTFLMIGRVTTNGSNYCDLDSNARAGLEMFGREARIACYVSGSGTTAFSPSQVTLAVPFLATNSVPLVPVSNVEPSPLVTTANYYVVTYKLVADPAFPGQQCLVRVGPALADTSVYNSATVNTPQTTYLVHYVQSLHFAYFQYNTATTSDVQIFAGTTPKSIKQIELTLTAQRSGNTLATATNTVLSARFTLRNKSQS